MKKIKIFRKKYPAPEQMVHGSHSIKKTKNIKEDINILSEQQFSTPYDDYLDKQHNKHLTGGESEDYETHMNNIGGVLSKIQDYNTLSPEQKKSARSYTSDSSIVNGELIDKYKKNVSINAQQPIGNVHIGDLDSATKKFTLPKMSLFHGASFDPTRLGKPTSDGYHIVHMPSFVSTSYDHSFAATTFASPDNESHDKEYEHMLEIKVPKEHPGLHIGNNSAILEREVLLPRGMTLKIKSQPTIYSRNRSYRSPGGMGIKVWEAHPVPDGEDPETWQPPK